MILVDLTHDWFVACEALGVHEHLAQEVAGGGRPFEIRNRVVKQYVKRWQLSRSRLYEIESIV
jgi:hypothetical protein